MLFFVGRTLGRARRSKTTHVASVREPSRKRIIFCGNVRSWTNSDGNASAPPGSHQATLGKFELSPDSSTTRGYDRWRTRKRTETDQENMSARMMNSAERQMDGQTDADLERMRTRERTLERNKPAGTGKGGKSNFPPLALEKQQLIHDRYGNGPPRPKPCSRCLNLRYVTDAPIENTIQYNTQFQADWSISTDMYVVYYNRQYLLFDRNNWIPLLSPREKLLSKRYSF